MFQIGLYKSIFNRSFFFDKCTFTNIYQCPKFKSITVRVNLDTCSKFLYYKLLIFFYLLTGQKPTVLIKKCSLRGIKKKKIVGLSLTLRKFELFTSFFVFRQLPLVPFFRSFLIKNLITSVSFGIEQRTQDDDVLLQLLKINDPFHYFVTFQTTANTTAKLQTLLIASKVPCRLV
jgi:hypothetical protein